MRCKFFFLFYAILVTTVVNSQDLNGKWTGHIVRNNNTKYVSNGSILEVEISHQGNLVSGKLKSHYPSKQTYVIQEFIGSVKDKTISMYDADVVVESKINRKTNIIGWWSKNMIGKIKVDKINNIMTIEGPWKGRTKWYHYKDKETNERFASGRFILSKKLEGLTEVSGVVYDAKQKKGVKTILKFIENNKVKYCESDINGNYSIALDYKSTCQIVIDSKDYEQEVYNIVVNKKYYTKDFFLTKKKQKEENNNAISLNKKVRLKKVLFKQSKAQILPESYPELNKLHTFLDINPETRIIIEGHTDKIGNSTKNLTLSKKRAKAIKEYLIKKGINTNRIKTIGYGDRVNVCKPKCKENRRVEFIIKQD